MKPGGVNQTARGQGKRLYSTQEEKDTSSMALEMITVPPELASVTGVFEGFCKTNTLEVLSEAVEKHGSWEWSGGVKGSLNRFVSLDLTALPDPVVGPKIYSAEVCVVADDNQRFTRRLASTFRASSSLFSESAFKTALTARLEQAWEQVNILKPEHLTESYLRTLPPTLPEVHQAACTTHCYCQYLTIGTVPQVACCMCGHRRVQNTFSFIRNMPRVDGKTFD